MKDLIYELVPVDNHKSFYGKALVIWKGRTKYLFSYHTIVAAITPSGKVNRYWSGYSATTARHITSFLISHGIPAMNKKEWLNLPLHNAARDYYGLTRAQKKRLYAADMTTTESLQAMYRRRDIDGANNY